jgi:hypothetical protein
MRFRKEIAQEAEAWKLRGPSGIAWDNVEQLHFQQIAPP